MIKWILSLVIGRVLDWILAFFTQKIKEAKDETADKAENHDIEQKVESADTKEEAQDALNDVARRNGRHN